MRRPLSHDWSHIRVAKPRTIAGDFSVRFVVTQAEIDAYRDTALRLPTQRLDDSAIAVRVATEKGLWPHAAFVLRPATACPPGTREYIQTHQQVLDALDRAAAQG